MTRRPAPRFNETAVRNGAQLHINLSGKKWDAQRVRSHVARQFFEQYGKAWGISSIGEMEKFLYERSYGRLRFQAFFEGKSKAEIMVNMQRLLAWRERQRKAAIASLQQVNANPALVKQNTKRVIDAHSARLRTDPAFVAAKRQRAVQGITAYNKSKKGRRNSRRNMKKRWADPAFRERVTALFRTPEFRDARGEESRARWNDPDYLVKQAYRGGMVLLRALVANRASERPTEFKGVGDIKLHELMAITTESTADRAMIHERLTRLVDEMERLPPIERQPIIETFFLGKSVKQIARKTKKPARVIRERMRRGLLLLRQRLERNVA